MEETKADLCVCSHNLTKKSYRCVCFSDILEPSLLVVVQTNCEEDTKHQSESENKEAEEVECHNEVDLVGLLLVEEKVYIAKEKQER